MHINIFVASMLQDLRYALRTLKNNRLITVAAIVALALGVGAKATVFTVVSSALRFDMGVDHVERMVVLHPGEGAILDPSGPAPLDVLNLRSQVKSVEHLAAYHVTAVNLSDSHALLERLWRVQMTASGWAMVRQKPLLGRSFGPADERADSTPTVMLTHKVWQRRYGSDPPSSVKRSASTMSTTSWSVSCRPERSSPKTPTSGLHSRSPILLTLG
jgi:hypothetical protein